MSTILNGRIEYRRHHSPCQIQLSRCLWLEANAGRVEGDLDEKRRQRRWGVTHRAAQRVARFGQHIVTVMPDRSMAPAHAYRLSHGSRKSVRKISTCPFNTSLELVRFSRWDTAWTGSCIYRISHISGKLAFCEGTSVRHSSLG